MLGANKSGSNTVIVTLIFKNSNTEQLQNYKYCYGITITTINILRMQINYLILAHFNLSQVKVMIDALSTKNTRFFIHIDKKTDFSEIKSHNLFKYKDVEIIRNRIAINWGCFSIVKATINLMKAAISRHCDGYFVLLSGTDFPIQSNNQIHSYLSNNYGKEFILCNELPYQNWANGGLDRIRHYWLGDVVPMEICQTFYQFQIQNNIQRPFFEDFVPFGGSQWWCLTTECVKYILKFIRFNPIILDFYYYSFIPDEMFFQTIIMNSPFRENVSNDNLKHIVFDKHQSHPRIFLSEDYERLIQSNKLWARKFDITLDGAIITQLINSIKD